MSSRPKLYREELGPAFVKASVALALSVLWLLALNIEHPYFAKGFDVPVFVLAAIAVFVSPKLALAAGLLTGIIADAYSDRLFIFHSIYYCLPGSIVLLIGEGLIARSNLLAMILVLALVIAKFVAQYFWLIPLGHGEWPALLFYINWWGAGVLGGVTFLFWNSLGIWLTGKSSDVKFRSGIYGR